MNATLYEPFPKNSKVWVYMSDQEISSEHIESLHLQLKNFVENWTAHQKLLKAGYDILNHRFIILIVDESVVEVSGCSIDTSVHFIQKLETEFNVQLLNRMLFGYQKNEKVVSLEKKAFQELIDSGEITPETWVYNNLVDTLYQLENSWKIPFKESWYATYFQNSLHID